MCQSQSFLYLIHTIEGTSILNPFEPNFHFSQFSHYNSHLPIFNFFLSLSFTLSFFFAFVTPPPFLLVLSASLPSLFFGWVIFVCMLPAELVLHPALPPTILTLFSPALFNLRLNVPLPSWPLFTFGIL